MSDARSTLPRGVKHHVYLPYRAGLPPMRRYFSDLWARRYFVAAYSRANIRAANTQTVFGQIWLVLNPLLLAAVYYLLVSVLGGARLGSGAALLAQITGGLFIFNLLSGAMMSGAQSIVSGGKLILNMNFPRLLMPLAAVRTSFLRFVPTIPVYLVIRAMTGEPWSWTMLLGLVYIALMVIFSIGLAALFATLMVYFRDTTAFLPYITRIWLYASPVLWPVDRITDQWYAGLMNINPLFSLIGGWQQTTLHNTVPSAQSMGFAAAWAFGMFFFGGLLFMLRERDFAVRI